MVPRGGWRLPWHVLAWVLLVAFAWGGLGYHYACLRDETIHHHTFDFALYTRMAWGLVRGDGWDPIAGGSFLGGHMPWVLYPLGALGEVLGTKRTLLAAQALAVALAAWPLALIAYRRAGVAGAFVALATWLLNPNLFHVVTYEFHPGTLAVWPMSHALDALDASTTGPPHAPELRRTVQRAVAFVVACIAVVACRASLALVTAFVGVLAMKESGALRRAGVGVVLGSIAYLALSWFVLRPAFAGSAPSSLDAHFGAWGGSPFGAVRVLVQDPARVVEHFATPARLGYLPRVLLPLALFPLLSPRWLVVAAPTVALNLLSEFPTSTELYSHYLTPAVPALVVAAIDGAAWLSRHTGAWAPSVRRGAWAALALAGLGGSVLVGGAPWSFDFAAADFAPDGLTAERRRIVAHIPPDASVQAPDVLLAQLARRRIVHRAPPPERGTLFVVLDLSHRLRYAHEESLLRTVEEPLVRTWLARDDHHVIHAEPTLLLLRRGTVAHETRLGAYRAPQGAPDAAAREPEAGDDHAGGERTGDDPVRLSDCLSLVAARLADAALELELLAHAACAPDLAVRFGTAPRPSRVELLFDGFFSPAHLRAGDRVRSRHALSRRESSAILRKGLRLGLLRASGAPPHPEDPVSVAVPLR